MAAYSQRSQPPAMPFSPPTSTSRGIVDKRHISFKPADDPALASGAIRVPSESFSPRNTNPFRTPTHSPHTSASSNSFAFSPVSPIEDNRRRDYPQPKQRHTAAPQPRKMSQEPRKSVDLRTIDGKPYPGHETDGDAKPRTVKVAQDMYAGELPPGYDSKDYKGPPTSQKGHKHTDSCHRCGGHKKMPSVASVLAESPTSQGPLSPQNIDCNKCGGKRSMPPSSFPGATNVRSIPPIQSSEAGPSNAAHGQKHKCTKCGRRKRPESMSTSSGSSQAHSPQQSSHPRQMPLLQTNGIPVNINIEPPTALTERAPTLPFSPASTVGETPLLNTQQQRQAAAQNAQKKGHSTSRSGSISKLFRSLSGRKKSSDHSAPAQPMLADGQANSGRKSSSYSRLQSGDRPPSPFSFMDKPQEEHAFEMNDMRQSKLPERRDSWDKADESSLFLSSQTERPKISRSQSTTAAKFPSGSAQPVDDVYLSLPPDQRPGITRFKSLRTGVNRAANGLSRSASQMSRSTSLRRLESVKKVPSLWYRDDMAIEGAASEYDNYGY